VNHQMLRTINGWAGHNWLLDHAMIFGASWLIYVVFAVAACCGLLLAHRRRWRPLGYFVATLAVSFGLLQLAGHLYVDQRPFMTQRLHQLVSHASGTSFPSDHTTAATAIALGLLVFTAFRTTGALLLLAALLIGFARIFVGIHWPIDIAGGLLTGLVGVAVVAVVALLLDGRRVWRPRAAGSAVRRDTRG
jgi:undecaprenyl-diphosphatase